MADPEDPVLQYPQAAPQGHVELVKHHRAVGIRTLIPRHHDGRQNRAVLLRIEAEDLQPPGPDRPARRLAVADVAREDVFEALLREQAEGLPETVEQVGRRGAGEEAALVGGVRASLKPDTFDMRRLFGVSGSLGIIMIIESAIFAVPALSYFGLLGNVEKIYTFGFAYLNLSGVFALMIVRERNHFWESRPSRFLSITALAEVLLVIAIGIFGILELAPLGYLPVLSILGYAILTTFVINDPIKVYLMRKFKDIRGSQSQR